MAERLAANETMPNLDEWQVRGQEVKRVRLDSLREATERYRCIILLGDPGSGKTTALNHLAFQLAGENPLPPAGGKAGMGGQLPLPLCLSEFGPGLTPETFILEGWGSAVETGRWGASDLAANLEGYLEQGRLFILFDALNEMPQAGFKERAAALRQFIDRWAGRGNRFLVTCRVLDYGQELTGLQRVEVLPLTEDQIEAFLVAEMVHQDDTCAELWQQLNQAGNQAERDQLYEQLEQELEQRGLLAKWQGLRDTLRQHHGEQRRLLELARNPYLLTIIIQVFLADGHLDNNRAKLMARFTRLLFQWAKGKCRPDQWLDADIQQQALAVMAFETQRRSGFGTHIKTELVKAVMPATVQPDPNWPPVAAPADQVLELAASASLIEMPVDRSSVRFYHQLLQEYFAASELLRRLELAGWSGFSQLSGLDANALWRWPWLESEMPPWERPEESWEPLPPPPPTNWEETTILAAGLLAENADRLLRRLIPVNPVLAGRCLVEGGARVGQPTSQAIIEALLATIKQPEVALRVRIAAGEILGYLGDPRLGELVTIPAGEFVLGSDRPQLEQAGFKWEE